MQCLGLAVGEGPADLAQGLLGLRGALLPGSFVLVLLHLVKFGVQIHFVLSVQGLAQRRAESISGWFLLGDFLELVDGLARFGHSPLQGRIRDIAAGL